MKACMIGNELTWWSSRWWISRITSRSSRISSRSSRISSRSGLLTTSSLLMTSPRWRGLSWSFTGSITMCQRRSILRHGIRLIKLWSMARWRILRVISRISYWRRRRVVEVLRRRIVRIARWWIVGWRISGINTGRSNWWWITGVLRRWVAIVRRSRWLIVIISHC